MSSMTSNSEIRLSPLGHTWILDLDGTIVKHNGYKTEGVDTLLPGARSFLEQIPQNDLIVFITSRTEEVRDKTVSFLKSHNIRFDHIIFNAPYGERILVNDDKPSGLNCALAFHFGRDQINIGKITIDNGL